MAGFGGRSLDDSQPKYLNSPRSPIFDKSRILYGMHLAKDAAREKGLVIVEGYLDAIMAHQHGFDNVVASMGTALTQEQVAQVKRPDQPGGDGVGRRRRRPTGNPAQPGIVLASVSVDGSRKIQVHHVVSKAGNDGNSHCNIA